MNLKSLLDPLRYKVGFHIVKLIKKKGSKKYHLTF